MDRFETWLSSKLPERICSGFFQDATFTEKFDCLLEPEGWIYIWGWRMRSAEFLCLLPSSGEMKIIWCSWGLTYNPRCAGSQGLGYLSLYILEELRRISEDWRASRLLGDRECQHTALDLALYCHWKANFSISPRNSSFMGLFTMEKVRWYLQELKFLLKMRWSEAKRDPGFFLQCSPLISVEVTASYQKLQLNFFRTVLPPFCILCCIKK